MDEIKLVKDTIDTKDLENLIDWLKGNPRLTKGELTLDFEKKWSNWLNVKYSIFVNSGSSANLASVYGLILSGRMKNKRIVVPAVSWVTTVTPAIQLGLEPIMCDCDEYNLGIDISSFKKIVELHSPSVLILVHVLGIPNHMEEIVKICHDNNIIIIEDTCESPGSKYNNKFLGTFGLLSTFSFYYGHHISTIEGGMISTNDEELYHILLSIRSHGWDRDLPEKKQKLLRQKYSVDEFSALYTFYYPGFNLRSTDLQAFIGIGQLDKIDSIVEIRNKNFQEFQSRIENSFWKIKPPINSFVSNFAYPIISEKKNKVVESLKKNKIECRPLICGDISSHPFWWQKYGRTNFENASRVHKYGFYVPNNHLLEINELEKIIEIVNSNL